jgi:D-alanyl-D-alanine carboxypeptidase
MRARTALATTAVLVLTAGLTATSAAVARTAPEPGFSPEQVTRLNAAIWKGLDGLPGGVVAGVWVPGVGSWKRAIGAANIQTGAPMTTDMQLPMGSITKTFTGTLVLQEIERGAIRLDDPLAKWYPDVPKADQITVGQLLQMSSGIGDHLGDDSFLTFLKQMWADPKIVYQPDYLIGVGSALPRQFDVPGTAFAYSNTNTVLLGRILEKVTGKPYETLLQERIFAPLGLTRTELRTTGGLEAPHPELYTTFLAYLDGPPLENATEWLNTAGWAAGANLSTLDDLHTWGVALGTGQGVLKPSTQRLRMANCINRGTQAGISLEYCLGTGSTRNAETGAVHR